jgi:hypothetical protein
MSSEQSSRLIAIVDDDQSVQCALRLARLRTAHNELGDLYMQRWCGLGR